MGLTVPENGLGLKDSILEDLPGLLTGVKTHPVSRDTLLGGGGTGLLNRRNSPPSASSSNLRSRRCKAAHLRLLREIIRNDKVHRQVHLDVLGLCLLHQLLDLLGADLVIKGLADLDVVEDVEEGEGHSSADDEGVDL